MNLQALRIAVFAAVCVGWFVFAASFLFGKKPPQAPERTRARASLGGIILQGLAYATAWAVRRPLFSAMFPLPDWAEIVLAVFTVALIVFSEWLVLAAARTLGKQWSFQARLVEGHKLVTEGPYRIVRNPIYTGMLGMLLATGLAVSHWIGLLAALVLFAIGTAIRVKSEEKLLRQAFGAEFEAYARRVPAVFPRLV